MHLSANGNTMTEIERRIIASQGYRELGLIDEARAELALLPAELRSRADVIEILALCLMDERQWLRALDYALDLCAADTMNPGGFIHAAFCLHELGRTEEAVKVLRHGPFTLKSKAVYFYNQACYHACLGLMDQAADFLQKAFVKDPSLRKAAQTDPDLAALKEEFH